MDPQALPDQRGPVAGPRWGLGEAVLGFLVALFLTTLVASAWLEVSGEEELSLLGRAVSQIGFWVGLVGAAWLACRRKGSGSMAVDFGLRARWSDVGTGLAAGVGAQLLVVPGVAFLLRPLFGEPKVDGFVNDLVDSSQGLAVVGLFVFVVLGAAVVEELFFRGLLLRALQRRVGTGAAVVLSGVVFGSTHIQDGATAEGLAVIMTSLAVLGALLAVLCVRTGRLGAAMIAHATFNAITLIVVFSR